ncbi:unnamed protein product, partial [marine sediment metagenome]
LPENSTVCGYVTNVITDKPIENANVDLYWKDNQGHHDWNDTYTNSSGYYKINVAAGTIDLDFSANGYYSESTDYYTIGENETIYVNISLLPHLPENSTVCGYVTNEITDQPIENAYVDLYWKDNQGHHDWNDTYTNSSGYYKINVAPGTIDLDFSANGYYSESTDYYTIGENETIYVNISLLPHLPENSTVCGYVTNEITDQPIENAYVDLYWKDNQGHHDWNDTYTNSSGYYKINVAAGTIDLYFSANGYYSESTDYY